MYQHLPGVFALILVSSNLTASTMSVVEICQYSDLGYKQCEDNFHAFMASQQHPPLSDYELQQVYGCLDNHPNPISYVDHCDLNDNR